MDCAEKQWSGREKESARHLHTWTVDVQPGPLERMLHAEGASMARTDCHVRNPIEVVVAPPVLQPSSIDNVYWTTVCSSRAVATSLDCMQRNFCFAWKSDTAEDRKQP